MEVKGEALGPLKHNHSNHLLCVCDVCLFSIFNDSVLHIQLLINLNNANNNNVKYK